MSCPRDSKIKGHDSPRPSSPAAPSWRYAGAPVFRSLAALRAAKPPRFPLAVSTNSPRPTPDRSTAASNRRAYLSSWTLLPAATWDLLAFPSLPAGSKDFFTASLMGHAARQKYRRLAGEIELVPAYPWSDESAARPAGLAPRALPQARPEALVAHPRPAQPRRVRRRPRPALHSPGYGPDDTGTTGRSLELVVDFPFVMPQSARRQCRPAVRVPSSGYLYPESVAQIHDLRRRNLLRRGGSTKGRPISCESLWIA